MDFGIRQPCNRPSFNWKLEGIETEIKKWWKCWRFFTDVSLPSRNLTLGKETRKLCHIFVYHISMYHICYNSYIYNIFIYILKVGWRLKNADIIFYMLTSLLSCYEEISKYLKKLMKIVNIAEEHLHIFWTTWRSSNEIFRKNITYDNTIGYRKTGLFRFNTCVSSVRKWIWVIDHYNLFWHNMLSIS